jgi:hypothetical protein
VVRTGQGARGSGGWRRQCRCTVWWEQRKKKADGVGDAAGERWEAERWADGGRRREVEEGVGGWVAAQGEGRGAPAAGQGRAAGQGKKFWLYSILETLTLH